MAVFLLTGVSTVQTFADEVQPESNKYVKSIDLTDVTNSAAKQYSVDDMMRVTWTFDIPTGEKIQAGEKTKFFVPLNFSIDKTTGIPGADRNGAKDSTDPDTGKVLGKTTVEDHYVVITWNENGAALINTQGVRGTTDALVGWNLPDKKHETKNVPINWGTDGSVTVPTAPTVVPSDPTPAPVTPDSKNNFTMNKSGDFTKSNDPGYMYWMVRLNGVQKTLTNAVLTDTMGAGQTLATNKIFKVYTYDIDKDGEWVNQQEVYPQPKMVPVYSQDGKDITGFTIDLGTIDKPTTVFYYTKYDYQNTADGTAFTNSASLKATETTDSAVDVPTAHKYFDYKTIINPHGRPNESDLKRVITHTTHYRDRQGNKLHDDTVQTITYTRDGNLDENGHFQATSDWTATPSSTFAAVSDTKIKGYKVVDDSENKALATKADSSSSESTIYYDRDVTPVTPDNPHGHGSDVEKTITHITHYLDRAGHKVHDDTVQVIVYKRAGELDADGHFTATSDWKAEPSDTFAAVELPTIDGYKVVNDSENKALLTTVDSSDSESTIVYDKMAAPVPDVNPSPNVPDTPTPDVEPTPSVPNQPIPSVNPARHHPGPFSLPATSEKGVVEESSVVESQPLPETGKIEKNQQNGWSIVLISILGMTSLFWRKSRQKKN